MGLYAVLVTLVALILITVIAGEAAEPRERYMSNIGQSFNQRLIDGLNDRQRVLMAYIRGNPGLMQSPQMRLLVDRFSNGVVQGMSQGRGGAGYTVNKGKEVRICAPVDGDMNTAVFVWLHELAHVATDQNGHGPEFWTNFAEILDVAVKAGIYAPQRFTKESPGSYCGSRITYQPLSDMGAKPRANFARNPGKVVL